MKLSKTHSPLSHRETVIAYWMAQGLKNREIAKVLKRSEHVTKNWIRDIFEKLGLNSRTLVSLWFIKRTHDYFNRGPHEESIKQTESESGTDTRADVSERNLIEQ